MYTILFSRDNAIKFMDKDHMEIVPPEIVLEALMSNAFIVSKKVKTVKVEDELNDCFRFYHDVTYVVE